MPQKSGAFVAQNPSGALALLQVNADGGLLLAEAEVDTSAVFCNASATTALGPTGAIGDVIDHLVISPTTTTPGNVSIKDGTAAAIVIFSGAVGVTNGAPINVPLGYPSKTGGWSVITGGGETVLAVGRFTP